ncbi:MAG: NADP(H)-dependent aldo-keto reductase [Sinobacteraceae bacterium]|nr:NADP(H)-dependent aldo-keto reductase [Nevskiaceae bacterium]
MSAERYRSLGASRIQVSELALGTMTWGEQNTEAEAHAQLDYALDQGVNLIDTAEMYPVPPRAETQGRTERYLGTWLKSRRCRERVVIATKVIGPGEFPWIRGGPRLTREHVLAACEASLERLQTDYLDLYQVHWPARSTNYFGQLGYRPVNDRAATPIEETLGALAELVRAGKVREIGISNETPWGAAEYLRLARERGWPRLVTIQNPYSLLNRSFEVGLAEFAHREKLGLLAYSPLAFGVLSGKYLDGARPPQARLTLFSRFTRYSHPQAEAATREYVALARMHGLDPAQMALAYVRTRPFVTSTIIGATTMEQLRTNLASAKLSLSAELLDGIEAIHRRYTIPCP